MEIIDNIHLQTGRRNGDGWPRWPLPIFAMQIPTRCVFTPLQAQYRLSAWLFTVQKLRWFVWYSVKWWMHDRHILSNFSRDTSHLIPTKGQQDNFTSIPCSCLTFSASHKRFRRGSSIYWPQGRQIPDETARAKRRVGKPTVFLVHKYLPICYSGDYNPTAFTWWNNHRIITNPFLRTPDCLSLSPPDSRLPEIWVALLV